LASCSDKEWDVADPAYGSELINLKKKPHKVTVFAAPRGKTIERTKIIKAEARPEGKGENNSNKFRYFCSECANGGSGGAWGEAKTDCETRDKEKAFFAMV
uniref:Lipoprotein n=1 Tax=Toxocara canis TaxID=6265 RepID=A0A183UTS7_TOXCA